MAPLRDEGSGNGDSSEDSRIGSISDGLSEGLIDVLGDESDGNLLFERRDVEIGVLQWIRALDLQALGACRADERLKPLFKLSASNGAAEDRLMAQMSQYFEAAEVGMLARCLCIPLVSIRVGKVHKQGNLLCPTSTRGHLNLSLLPSSNMHISFIGDDGSTERLTVVINDFKGPPLVIEEIAADSSGRSFLLRMSRTRILYFWCSEKSKLHGVELLAKMNNLLRKKPSLSYLSGISESRLDVFATHLRSYLRSSSTRGTTSTSLLEIASHLNETESELHPLPSSPLVCPTAAHPLKVQPFYKGTLGPKSSTFKDGTPRSSLLSKSGAREKPRRRGGNSFGLSNVSDQQANSVPAPCESSALSTINFGDERFGIDVSRSNGECFSTPCCLPQFTCLSSSLPSFNPADINYRPSNNSIVPGSLLSPYYCWCPPSPSPLQWTTTTSHLPITSIVSLPPLSSLLASVRPPVSLIPSKLSIDAIELPSLNLPSLFPDQLARLLLPVSSLATLPISQQIPTFTPFMSDPIVHIPIIDACSSGQGYLFSAGPSISSAIAPLLPSRASPLITEGESLVEKSARETLRMLMASAPAFTSPDLMKSLPGVFNRAEKNIPISQVSKHASMVCGSRCLYTITLDVKLLATTGVLSKGRLIHDRQEYDEYSGDSEGPSCTKGLLPD